MIYKFIYEHHYKWTIEMMCRVLEVSRSSYYLWKKYPKGKRTLFKEELESAIEEVYFDAKGRYGSPRIREELMSKGRSVSQRTVAKYMRNMGLRSKLSRKWKATTDSTHKEPVAENILNRDFISLSPAEKWASDITYIQTTTDFLYLTTVIDLYDRKVIGWSISDSLKTKDTVLLALRMAVNNRKPKNEMIFHSDRGVQYACRDTVNYLKSYKFTQSMSRKGNCWDNAVAESFFKSLKTELIYGNKLLDKKQMKILLFEYIEIWYNKKRRHSYLDYLTIPEFNEKHNVKNKNTNNAA